MAKVIVTRAIDDATLDLGVVDLAALLDGGVMTSLALTEAYLARIARRADLNAFITVTTERALADARSADEARSRGVRGPLLGIPYALKDLVDTQGIPTTWGTRGLLGRVPTRDADVTARLRQAGGVLLGKLSMTELANGYGNMYPVDNHGGACRNPWNPAWWAGGSSAGSGAATAAGLCGFSIGSETWGSIDCPAAFCSVTGYRPTYDVVSRQGAMPLSYSLDKLGVLAREARDVPVVLDAIAQTPVPLRERTGKLRIAVVEFAGRPPGREYLDAWALAQAALRTIDATVETISIAYPDHRAAACLVILLAERDAAFNDLVRAGPLAHLYDHQPWDEKRKADRELGMSASDYVLACRVRTQVQREWQARFERFDVVVCAGYSDPPAPVEQRLSEEDFSISHAVVSTEGNLAGLPAVTLPMGFSAEGFPLSIHAVASPYDDRLLLEVAAAFQARTDIHKRRPPSR